MPYRIVVSRRAERDLERIDTRYARRLRTAIEGLADDPRRRGVEKVRGMADGYRLRAGDYRALFIIDDDSHTVHVRRCGHRTDIYRRL